MIGPGVPTVDRSTAANSRPASTGNGEDVSGVLWFEDDVLRGTARREFARRSNADGPRNLAGGGDTAHRDGDVEPACAEFQRAEPPSSSSGSRCSAASRPVRQTARDGPAGRCRCRVSRRSRHTAARRFEGTDEWRCLRSQAPRDRSRPAAPARPVTVPDRRDRHRPTGHRIVGHAVLVERLLGRGERRAGARTGR